MKTVISEARIKVKVRKVLAKYKSDVYYYMPVPGGYGRSSLDYLGFCCGLGFAIETKRTDGKVTERQQGVIEQLHQARVPVFVINDDETLRMLDVWLNTVVARRDANVSARRRAEEVYAGCD